MQRAPTWQPGTEQQCCRELAAGSCLQLASGKREELKRTAELCAVSLTSLESNGKKKIDSAPGISTALRYHWSSWQMWACAPADHLVSDHGTNKGTAVNLSRQTLNGMSVFLRNVFAAFLSSYEGSSEPKDVIRKEYFLGV